MVEKTKRLEGKYILLTGASRGLGRALALDFARAGAKGLVLVARTPDELSNVAKLARRIGNRSTVLPLTADIQSPEEIERIVATTFDRFEGHLDVLVNNASTIGPTPMPLLVDYPLEDFREVLNTNLISPFLFIKKALPALIESHGSIINVTSDAGRHGYPGWGAYGISKFGIEGLSETWAAELADMGVRVNLVDPGDMNTAMHRAAEPGEDYSQWANPEDVTEVFVYLTSDESRNVTGKRFQAQSSEWIQKRKQLSQITAKARTK